MNTDKLYQKDQYLKSCNAKLVDVTQSKNCFTLVLNQTIFFPTGGGQSCDKGKINNLEVVNVYEKEGIIFHEVQCNNSNIVLNIDDEVCCEIDWQYRFLNMQRHCGEHILSGIFYREYGGINRGFHMGETYMTIDISLEENPEIKTLTWEMVKKAEEYANQVIWSNAPITIRHFQTREEAAHLPLRKALAIDKDISIVCVGDINNPADCVACCGTHPSTAGQVGFLKILKVESYKGMFRVYCEAGRRAMEIFNTYHEIMTKLNKKYSATPDDLLDKMTAQEEKTKAVRAELHTLKQSVIKDRIATLSVDLKSLGSSSQKKNILIKEYDDMKIDDLLNIGRPLISQLSQLLIIVSRPEKTMLLFSDGKIDCGKLVKENASIYQGKGGGNNTSARAIFPKVESIDTFLDLLDKHLR
ncbi:alanyl-tRNA editing protein [Aminipila sp.]|uniref:alanyl-tRNA editing protein n=1 Tax=Aminipila sp. TaxID=2060095 RepID=UPI00289AB597|nr:alanine--tRNA ligase-related protein [Aminipila sp.]